MGMDVSGIKPTTEQGEYFRASIWGWPSVLHVAEMANEAGCLGFDMKGWRYNDGDGLKKQDDCTKLADAMSTTIVYLKRTGEKHLPEKLDMAKGLESMFKDSGMKVMGFEKEGIDFERVENFIGFLRTCGGFEIF